MQLEKEIAHMMEQNRRRVDGYSYTIPSPELYPFQWLWDSCFHAIILSHIDIDAAKKELHSAVAKPMENGLLPHIIYWEQVLGESRMNWGRELRGDVIDGSWGVEGTSSITQPAFIVKAVWRVYEKNDDRAFLSSMYPALHRYMLHLMEDRQLFENGLLFIVNPDESGEDNSPRFDVAQHLPIDHSADDNLTERIRLMHVHKNCHFQARMCTRKVFSIADVSFNVIYQEALHYMAKIASKLDLSDDALFFKSKATESAEAIRTHLCESELCFSHDLKREEKIPIKTWNIFMPLYGGLLTDEEATRLVNNQLCNTECFWTPYPVPTVATSEPSYNTAHDAFWRGLVWMAPNWFIYKGLRRYGFDDIAATLKQKSIELIETAGFREQYHPETGEGLGAHDFTWGGLVLDME